ncbi:VOC family protein [Pseudohoeflea coraliihabitans]|uniref:VOC family protein n=1 Tax=Pseudohoeflea coraliihabitans TaxID=2860393 RepID=A0ABS6WUS2_9HYPH|nr:VOC family protein [Pseudohoeflea sp. DP4N28-3]MBW3098804.1 VOC family protein [Pseudohoeflea sp. DP4N28-3]
MTFASRITLVTLGVEDVARATAFYARLGLKKSSASTDSVSFFHMNGTLLGLFGREALAEDAQVEAGAKPAFTGVSLAQNHASEAEVDAAWQFALQCGATPLKKPEKVFWGGYSGYFADPDGHLWELAYNPLMPLGPDGEMQLPD